MSTIGAGKGVPFYLRTGKRMPERKTEIFIQFKCVPHSIFASRGASEAQQAGHLDPAGREYPPAGDGQDARPRPRGHPPARSAARHRPGQCLRRYRRRIAYERLLLDLIDGDPTLFVRRDEVEAQWQWIDQVRAAGTRRG